MIREKKINGLAQIEDITHSLRSDEGFMRIQSLRIANQYEDGKLSEPYRCDLVYRRQTDAVAIVLFILASEPNQARVVFRRCLRPPVFFRPRFIQYDWEAPCEPFIWEIPAGVIEEGEVSRAQITQRAVQEVFEETGIHISGDELFELGEPFFTSPGFTVEKVFIQAVSITEERWLARVSQSGDGSLMEEGGELILVPLEDAISRSYEQLFFDGKTELALYRLQRCLTLKLKGDAHGVL